MLGSRGRRLQLRRSNLCRQFDINEEKGPIDFLASVHIFDALFLSQSSKPD